MNSKDAVLLERLQVGDVSAFKEIFDFYCIPLTMYSFKYCNSIEMAEDITQELFVKFWDDKIYLQLNNAIGPYLFKAIKNNTLQAIKQSRKFYFEDLETQVNELIDIENIDLEQLEKEKTKLFEEIELLPEKSKEVFKAIVLENLKYKEVAEQLNISVNTVKTHYSRALNKLRKSMDVAIVLLLM